ncbi:DegT/DnrJ/EryC1/StrS aminotransferase family protein [Ancylobacter dichloromethanicus]|uniref:Aminotransferase DegT n=1 Tax=Ancylobacter dichloromethanicus TaxID=518825 RepID=A0A9W6J857_9HYPH|nr:DegT/DnrJ/EryC1/StrS aminotransferase family protein [Ancylobacter dichloromethanicus]MBS7553936.1 DegT/DnrJ/EryC1/StrS aminotransferase family protein [Ancylobacter dichloromethanicus]GLK71044.1 aminotransferase DegT [Ancylobacter dichloromethanicus]
MNSHVKTDQAPIPFVDIAAQRARLGTRIDDAVARVLAHCRFINGPEVTELEQQLAAFAGARHAVACSSGTDALAMILMAWGVKPGDAVFCPAFTFCATAEVVPWVGATPVFVDILEDTFNMDPASLEAAIAVAKREGLTPKVVVPVDLFGQPADMDAIAAIAGANGLKMLCDTAQGFGATWNGRRTGSFGDATATSFFPAKPLGCYGDGGAVLTDDDDLVPVLKSVREHGQGVDKYQNVRLGMTGRLDTIQAAVLLEKLAIFEDEIAARQRVARRYDAALADVCTVPAVDARATSVWAQYTIRLPHGVRDGLAAALQKEGVPTAVYYRLPMHRQPAYAQHPTAGNGLPVCEKLAGEVISLPMHPYLDEAAQDRVIAALRRALGA